MFKGLKKHKSVKGIPASPYSSIKGFLTAIFIVLFGIWCFLNPVEVIKWIGYPFLMIADALGIVDQPTKDEIGRAIGQQGTAHEIELTRTGVYYLHRSFWDSWGAEPDQYSGISLDGPNGPVDLHTLSGVYSGPDYTEPVSPFGPDTPVRRLSFFYPPHAPCLVRFWFEVTEPGIYVVRYSPTDDPIQKEFDASLVPEYLHGHETAVHLAVGIQIVVLLGTFGSALYFKKIKPGLAEMDANVESQLEKRISMDDFLQDIKKNTPD